MVVFDENGKAVNNASAFELFCSNDVKAITCPNCGSTITYPLDVITSKTKARECPRCKLFLGEW